MNRLSFRALLPQALALLAVCAALCVPSLAMADAGLALHYYGERAFWIYGGSLVLTELTRDVPVNSLRWPANNWDSAKGPVFHRSGGWSLVCRGQLTVPVDGDYAFTLPDPANMLLQVDALAVPADGMTSRRLLHGAAAFALYWRSSPQSSSPKLGVQWRRPGETAFQPIPATALSHTAADVAETASWRPDIPFVSVTLGVPPQRALPFTIPADGWYDIAAQFSGIPRIFKVWLDGAEPLLYLQGDRALAPEQFQPVDMLNRVHRLQYLRAGKHVAAVYGSYSPWIWGDTMDEVLRNVRIGATRVRSDDFVTSLSVRTLDTNGKPRQDLVLRKGEPLLVQVAKNTLREERFTLSVQEQRGDGQPVWRADVRLPAGKTPALATLRYPCDRQGGFEYRLSDSAGKTVDGPWAFAVVDATPAPPAPTGAPLTELRGEVVDRIDCTLASDAAHKLRDNGTSQVVDSPLGRYRVTGTSPMQRTGYVKDKATNKWRPMQEGEQSPGYAYSADWFAYTMTVKHPGAPHMLVAYVPNDLHRLVSVQAFDQITGNYNGWCLEAGDAPEGGPYGKLAFLVWPNSTALDVLTWCSNDNHGSKLNRQGAVAKFELIELPADLPLLPTPAAGWEPSRECGWGGEQINIGPFNATMPSIWAGNAPIAGSLPRNQMDGAPYYDWRALLTAWERFGQVTGYRGDNLCIMPVYSYGMSLVQGVPHLPQVYDIYSKGYRARVVDPIDRDIFKMMLLVAERRGLRIIADLMVQRLSEGTLAGFAQVEGVTNMDGVFVTNPNGGILRTPTGVMLNPAHPLARKYLLTVIDELATRYGAYPAFGGIRIRHWAGWPSETDAWFLNEQNGYDDFTVGLFEKETGVRLGVTATGDERFKLRRDCLLAADKKERWLDWRCRKVESLLEEELAVLQRHAPKAILYNGASFTGTDAGSRISRGGGLDPARLAGKRALGFSDSASMNGPGVEWNFPDPVAFANFDIREPASLRRTLDNYEPSGFCYPIGMTCNESYRAYPYELQKPAAMLAENKLDMFTYGPAWCIPPVDEGFRRFVQVFRAIPRLPYTRFAGKGADQPAVACWFATRPGKSVATICYMVNTTAKRRVVSLTLAGAAAVTNLVDGRRLLAERGVFTITLDPFMPAVVSAIGNAPVTEMRVPPTPAEREKITAQIASLQAISQRIGAVRHVFTRMDPNAGPWDARDTEETFAQVWTPLQRAWQSGSVLEAGHQLDRLLEEHTWWFEAFGWPTGTASTRRPDGFARDAARLAKALKADGELRLADIAPYQGQFVQVPSGNATLSFGSAGGGSYELRLWGLFGGGYGPISVRVDGKEMGRIGVDAPESNTGVYILPVPIALARGGHGIELRAEGGKGFALTALEMTQLPPTPIRRWSALGVFDKETPLDAPQGLDKPFPPEQGVDLHAGYTGIGGREIRWRTIDIGQERIIRLLENYFPNTEGNGVAYLACWVKSPNERDVQLYYAMDWTGKVWLNETLVLPNVSGPSSHFADKMVHLKTGWNTLLVKTTRGTDGWLASFAFSDPGDLSYSPVPPEGAVR
ncbi:MAG TPA: hypothetical protein VGL77_06290 [Armatimonadota bacterium]|jgi:hypothetical protein